MLAATSATVTGCSYSLWLPSGSVITGMLFDSALLEARPGPAKDAGRRFPPESRQG